MNETGTIHEAAAVFSALSGDQVIELLSRLETHDAQHLLATAAKMTSTASDLKRASALLAQELSNPRHQLEERHENSNSNLSRSAKQQPKRSKQSSKQRNGKQNGNHSLDFLTDMPRHDIQRLLTEVSTACWAPVLKAESNKVRDAVFDNVAPAIERILLQEIASFDGNPQVARISRKKIIDAAKELQSLATDSTIRKAG